MLGKEVKKEGERGTQAVDTGVAWDAAVETVVVAESHNDAEVWNRIAVRVGEIGRRVMLSYFPGAVRSICVRFFSV